jgi:hypothetical protein
VGLHQCPSERKGEGASVRSLDVPSQVLRPPAECRQTAGLFAFRLGVHR